MAILIRHQEDLEVTMGSENTLSSLKKLEATQEAHAPRVLFVCNKLNAKVGDILSPHQPINCLSIFRKPGNLRPTIGAVMVKDVWARRIWE